MKKPVYIIAALLLFTALLGFSSAGKSKDAETTLSIYGPGGPLGPINELAKQFTKETGIKVSVTAGPESKWIETAKQDADVIYGGSEYMLRNLMLKYPGFIDAKSKTELYPRAAGILVRKGIRKTSSPWKI